MIPGPNKNQYFLNNMKSSCTNWAIKKDDVSLSLSVILNIYQ